MPTFDPNDQRYEPDETHIPSVTNSGDAPYIPTLLWDPLFSLTADEQVVAKTNLGITGGGGGTPGGANTSIQFNDSGALGGLTSFLFDKTTLTLTIDSATINSTFYTGSSNTSLFSNYASFANIAIFANTANSSIFSNNATYLGGIAAGAYLLVNAATFGGTVNASVFSNNTSYLGGYNANSFLFANGTALSAITANNTSYLGGIIASGYLLANGTALSAITANNTSYLGGIIASGYLLANAGAFSGQSATSLAANNSTYLGGIIASGYMFANGIAVNALFSNNSAYLGGVAAAQYAYANTVLPVANSIQAISGVGNNSVITPWSVAQAVSALATTSAWITKTSAYTAVNGDKIAADTTAGSFTITLPVTPVVGAIIRIADYAGTWYTNKLTIARNGSNILGSNTDLICDLNGQSLELIYMNASQGWTIETPSVAVSPSTYIPPTFQKFLTPGTFTYTPTSPDVRRIRVRMVAGGGGGAGSSNTSTAPVGSAGSNTVFGTLLTAVGGPGGLFSYGGITSVAGGGATIVPPAFGMSMPGGAGSGSEYASSGNVPGGTGGGTALGGSGTSSPPNWPPIPNSGIGGSGGYIGAPSGGGASGGGGGGSIDAWITSLASSYSITIGAGGTAGVAGTSGNAGSAGASGGMWIEEYYDVIAAPVAPGSLRYDQPQALSSAAQLQSRQNIGSPSGDDGAWTSYTPLAAGSGSTSATITINTARYKKIGKTVFFNFDVVFTSMVGSPARLMVQTPSGWATATSITGSGFNVSTLVPLIGFGYDLYGYISMSTCTNPPQQPAATSHRVVMTGFYEEA